MMKSKKVTFAPKHPDHSDKQIIEWFDETPHSNGFVPDYKLRAMAMNWRIVLVEEFGVIAQERKSKGEKIPQPPKGY